MELLIVFIVGFALGMYLTTQIEFLIKKQTNGKNKKR